MAEQLDPGSEMARRLGVIVVARVDGEVTTELEIRKEHTNAAGIAHGATIAALMDITLSLASVRADEAGVPLFAITLSTTTNFLAPVRPGLIRCRARRIGGGRRTVYCESRIVGANEIVLATASSISRLVPYTWVPGA